VSEREKGKGRGEGGAPAWRTTDIEDAGQRGEGAPAAAGHGGGHTGGRKKRMGEGGEDEAK